MISKLLLGAFALTIMSGAAYADSTTGSSALDNPDMMKPFYTDSTMKTMHPMKEFKEAWMKMSKDDQAKMTKECSDETIAKAHNNFCDMTKQLGGGN